MTTLATIVVKTMLIPVVPSVNRLQTVNAKVLTLPVPFDRIINMNDSSILTDGFFWAVPDLSGDHSSLMVRNVTSVQSIYHSEPPFARVRLFLNRRVRRAASNQVGIPKSFAFHTLRHVRHLHYGVGRSVVVPPLEFINVTMQMLWRHMMKGALIAALQHRPERLHAVCMRLFPHPVTYLVSKCLVLSRKS